MTSDPFNFGPPPDSGPGSQPGAPRGPFGDGGSPFGGPPPGSSGGPAPAPSTHQRPAPSPYAQNPLAAPQQSAGAGGAFGAPAASRGLAAAKPPVWLLFVAAGLALIAGIVALLLDAPAVAILCWVVAGPVAIGLLALFVVKDTFARSSGLYAAPGWVKPFHYGAIALCLLCILVPALRIADWVGRL